MNRDNFRKISDDEMAKISLGFSTLYNQLQNLKYKRKTAPELLQELLEKGRQEAAELRKNKISESTDPLNEHDQEMFEFAEWFAKDLNNNALTKFAESFTANNCEQCGRCRCKHCIEFMQEHNMTCESCDAFTPKPEQKNDDAWNTARDYYRKVYEKSIAKMTADQEFARLLNEKFENERFTQRAQQEYENAMIALENAKEKYEKSKESSVLLTKRMKEVELKKTKAHDEYEWICNNAPKR